MQGIRDDFLSCIIHFRVKPQYGDHAYSPCDVDFSVAHVYLTMAILQTVPFLPSLVAVCTI